MVYLSSLIYALALTACGSGDAAPTAAVPVAVPTSGVPVPPVAGPLTLYVADYGNASLRVYRAPLSSQSSPSFSISLSAKPIGLAFSGTTLAVADVAGNISIFNSPISASSVPSTVFSSTQALTKDRGSIAFDPNGNLWVSAYQTAAAVSTIVEIKPPFSALSSPAKSIKWNGFGPYSLYATGLAFDANANMYVANESPPVGGVQTVTPPYDAPPGNPFWINAPPASHANVFGVALFGLQAAVADDAGGVIYLLNFPNPTQPTPYLPSPQNAYLDPSFLLNELTYDAIGDVYAADGRNEVLVYAAPIAAGEQPTFLVTSGLNSSHGVAIGP